MTKAEFIQQAALGAFNHGFKDPWGEAAHLTNAAPAGTFDAAPSKPASAGKSGVTVPFGRNKGMAIEDAPETDLRYIAKRSIETLNDPAKSRYHEEERNRINAYKAELKSRGLSVDEFSASHPSPGTRAPPVAQTMPDDPNDGIPPF